MRRPTKMWGIALAALLAMVATVVVPAGAGAEQASQPGVAAAGQIDAGKFHSCAVVPFDAGLRCWGYGGDGALGYGNRLSIGDDETPAAVGPVRVGTVAAIGAGAVHTCALTNDAGVRCWGFGGDGRLGYANTVSIGDDETPDTVGLVAVGGPARAITGGRAHSCAILADGTVRCWGFNFDGRLGYPDPAVNPATGPRPPTIGDTETPAEAGPVALGADRTATAISAGDAHTCAILDDRSVRCWGFANNGQLGNGSIANVGDDETPDAVPPVPLGAGANAIAAGDFHTCAIVDGGHVRCWGFGGNGRLGLGNQETVGDNEPASAVPPVDLGPGRTARAITAGEAHTCAILDDGSVRCWGNASSGQLGLNLRTPEGRPITIGDDETPGSVGPVDLGPGRTAVAIAAGGDHTCARLDDGSVRCWGRGLNGEIGNCVPGLIGDDETPADSGPVDFGVPGSVGAACPVPAPAPPAPAPPAPAPPALPAVPNPPATPSLPGASAALDAALRAQAARARDLRACRSAANRRARAQRSRARRLIRRRAALSRALRRIAVRAGRRRAHCTRRFSRRPARVRSLTARALANGRVVLTFQASGTSGMALPAARRYVVKQSRRPIRTARDFRRAATLCRRTCFFDVTQPRTSLSLTVTDLRRRRTYFYAVAARDNVSGRRGPRSRTVRVRTR